jgi:Skp family chaperone for outer membrane proteins
MAHWADRVSGSAVLLALICLLVVPPAVAQEQGAKVLVVDMLRIRSDTAAGKDMIQKIKDIRQSIEMELAERADALQREEQRLAEERPKLTLDEFTSRVRAFEQQVFANREFSERANRRLQLVRSNGSKLLRERVTAVLAKIMLARDAEVMLDASQIVLSVDRLDITDEAIERLDEIFPAIPIDMIEAAEE